VTAVHVLEHFFESNHVFFVVELEGRARSNLEWVSRGFSSAQRRDLCLRLYKSMIITAPSVIPMDLATIQDWTKNERERRTAADHLSAINTIATCLNGSESPNAVAVMITAIYVEKPVKNGDSNRVQDFWIILCDAARIFGSTQSRLIDPVHEISTQPDVYATDGSLAKDPNGMVYWRDVPGLSYALCDDALCSFPPLALRTCTFC
jgi:hypothetical protein